MGAPASLSPLEGVLLQAVLDRVVPRFTGPVVIEFPQPGPQDENKQPEPHAGEAQETAQPGEGRGGDVPPEWEGAVAEPLALMRTLAVERARIEARMVQVAQDVCAATGAALLADKGFASVEELSATGRKKWRAEAKATAVAELQVVLGTGLMAARRLVGLANAPAATRATVVGALQRGEASLDLALRFWERCARLDDQVGADVAEALFGTDPATAAEERLDARGDLRDRPWHVGEYDAALERESLRREGQDVEARREQRRRARQERDTTMRVHDDGTATLTVRCPLTTGAAIYQRIDRTSRSLRGAGDPRTLAQLRADIASALLLHGVLPLPGWDQATTVGTDQQVDDQDHDPDRVRDPGSEDQVTPADMAEIARILAASPPVQLQVVVPWEVLTGRPAGAALCPAPCCRTSGTEPGPPDPPDGPRPSGRGGHRHERERGRGAVGQVLGLPQGFITPEHARVLAMSPGTTLARLLTDPADGRLIERSIPSYRPDADMRRQVRAADVTSRAPGSRRPAAWCDLDHEHPWADGGPTSEANLNCKDRRSHGFKTKKWWTTTMAPNRDVSWTTLLGQSETTRCHDYRQYLDERAPLDPAQAGVHPSQRTDHDDRLDVAGRALYAALVHRGPHAHLADSDDAHGATDHDPSLGGWVWVTHTNPDGIRRHGPPAGHPTVHDILGIPTDHQDDPSRDEPGKDRTRDSTSRTDTNGVDRRPDALRTPWGRRADDDTRPPF